MIRDDIAQLMIDEEQRRAIPAAPPPMPPMSSLADQSLSPHEIAAARVAQAARPPGGRGEGAATNLPTAILSQPFRAARGLVEAQMGSAAEQFPLQTMSPGEQRTISTDYDPRRHAAALGAETALNLTGLPAVSPSAVVPAGGIGIFAGRRSATIDKAALREATAMEKAGAAPDVILDKTGFERRAYKKWRYEIGDETSSINPDVLSKAPLVGSGQSDVGFPMSAVYNHPKLYEAYPHTKNVEVKRLPADSTPAGIRGAYDPDNNQILLHENLSPQEAREVIQHELQHSVQNFEKFSQGGSQYLSAVKKRGKELELETFKTPNSVRRICWRISARTSTRKAPAPRLAGKAKRFELNGQRKTRSCIATCRSRPSN